MMKMFPRWPDRQKCLELYQRGGHSRRCDSNTSKNVSPLVRLQRGNILNVARNVSPSLLSAKSKMFPRRPCRHPPEVKCFPVAATGSHPNNGETFGEMFPRRCHDANGETFVSRSDGETFLGNVSPLASVPTGKHFPQKSRNVSPLD